MTNEPRTSLSKIFPQYINTNLFICMEPVAVDLSCEVSHNIIMFLDNRCILLYPLLICHQGDESSSDDLRKLSDVWEFQENEIMHAQNKLRSTRAKLAVLEGKMAMAIMYAKFLFYFLKTTL